MSDLWGDLGGRRKGAVQLTCPSATQRSGTAADRGACMSPEPIPAVQANRIASLTAQGRGAPHDRLNDVWRSTARAKKSAWPSCGAPGHGRGRHRVRWDCNRIAPPWLIEGIIPLNTISSFEKLALFNPGAEAKALVWG